MPATNWTDAQVLAQLNSGLKWTGATITYRFPTAIAGLTASSGETGTFTAFNAAQQVKAIVAIGLWDDLIAPSLVQTAATNTASNIEFGNSKTGVSFAQAYYPTAGTVWFNTTYADLQTPVIGKHGFLTMVHELGHAFGLNHMGNYNGAGAATPSSYQDSTVLSIMSYFGPSWGAGAANGEGLVAWADWIGADGVLYSPQTPMLNDIMAIQAMYGADTTTRTGNTTYGFNSTVGAASGGIYDFTSNLHAILCLYDAGGVDTLDLSGWSTSCSISLVPGTFSSGNSMTNNISISSTTVIENAVGGAGDDVIVGNAYDNTLNGGGGADTITGGMGNDTIIGGAGTDTAVYSGAFSSYTVSYNAATQTFTISNAADGTDTVTGVENFVFNGVTKTAASMIPANIAVSVAATTASANEGNSGTTAFTFTVTLASAATSAQSATYTVAGNGTNAATAADFSSALTGTVSFAVGEISKTITVLVAGDTVFEQNETFGVILSAPTSGLVLGTAAATATILNDDVPAITGTASSETLTGTTIAEIINGLAGDDIIRGNGGGDIIDGGDGNDTIYFFATDNWAAGAVKGGLGADTLYIAGGANLPSGIVLAGNGFEFAEWTQTDTTGQSWDHSKAVCDANFNLLNKTTWNDDGTRVEQTFDVAQSQTWSQVENTLNSLGQLTKQHTVFDNGTSTDTNYDASNSQIWSNIRNDFDVSSRLTQQVTSYDNGVSTQIFYDFNSNANWSTIRYDYNSAWQWTQQVTTFDNGVSSYINYDSQNTSNWLSARNDYDLSFNILQQVVVFDDGTSIYTSYDVDNSKNWSVLRNDYNSAMQKTQEVINFDNGIKSYTYFDVSNTANWASARYDLDSNLNTVQTVFNFDDGIKVYKSFDVGNVLSWAQFSSILNADSVLIETVKEFDTGAMEDIIYDSANAQPWAEWHRTYDAAGQLVSEFYL
jgi:Peptidase M10 serralysin C terminal/RTX calcium-binding nonapeptide repeat (4 copies)